MKIRDDNTFVRVLLDDEAEDAFERDRIANLIAAAHGRDSWQGVSMDAAADYLGREDVIDAYRSIKDAVSQRYLTDLPARMKGWLAQARRFLADEGMGIIVATAFLSGIKRNINDLKSVKEMGQGPEISIDDLYSNPFVVTVDFHRALSRMVDECSSRLGLSGGIFQHRWREAFREVGDVIHDSNLMLHQAELMFQHLRYVSDERMLGDALEILNLGGLDRLDTSVESVRRLNLIRASSNNVWINRGWTPALAIPEDLRSDFARVVNSLVHNAVRFHDRDHLKHGKGERKVSIMAVSEDHMVQLGVFDNGRGERDIQSHLALGGSGGLRIAKDIAMKNGWGFDISSTPYEGTRATLKMDISGWGTATSALTGASLMTGIRPFR